MYVDYSKTYLYKLHKLTNLLDRAFDDTLCDYADITLSQFILLIAVGQLEPANQYSISRYLDQSPAAISRQVDIAKNSHLLGVTVNPDNKRESVVILTAKGHTKISTGLIALEQYLFSIFDDSDQSDNLMSHIDQLLINTKGVLNKRSANN